MFEMKFKGQAFFLNWGFFYSLEGVLKKKKKKEMALQDQKIIMFQLI
jgi:hypothetical protein